jgi:hypothetical protein
MVAPDGPANQLIGEGDEHPHDRERDDNDTPHPNATDDGGLLVSADGIEVAAEARVPQQELDGTRVASTDVPVPSKPVLKYAYRPDVPRIVEAAARVIQF